MPLILFGMALRPPPAFYVRAITLAGYTENSFGCAAQIHMLHTIHVTGLMPVNSLTN